MRAALEATTQRLRQHFANPAARATAGSYLQSLLSGVERKNSWQLAEAAGLDTPYRFKHLLGRGAWDADALRDEQLGVVLGGLGKEDAVLAIDETGFIKQGKKSVGVKRQYPGTSGKIDNCQIGVFLSLQAAKATRSSTGRFICRKSGPRTKRDGKRRAYPKPWSSPPSRPWRARWFRACWPQARARRGWSRTQFTEPITSYALRWRKPGSSASGWALASSASKPSKQKCPPTLGLN